MSRLPVALSGHLIAMRFLLTRTRLSAPNHEIARNLARNIRFERDDVKTLIAGDQSIVRWGDGDTMSALCLRNSFEPGNQQLATELIQLLQTAFVDPNLKLALPMTFLVPELRGAIPPVRLRPWGLTLLFLAREIRSRQTVGDSFMFRNLKGATRLAPEVSLSDLLDSATQRGVIAVGPAEFISRVGDKASHALAGSVRTQPKCAFSKLDETTRELRKIMRQKPGSVVLVSAGSAGRLLIGRLYREGTLLDVGQIR